MIEKLLSTVFATLGLLLTGVAGAAPVPTENLSVEALSGPTKGHLRVEWNPDDANDGDSLGSLEVFFDGALIQSFHEKTFTPPGAAVPYLLLDDLSGDGYADLRFMHMVNGGSQEFHLVYLWVPALNQFVKSATLSDRGEIQPRATLGCVASISLCQGRNGYFREEFCFNAKTGRWRLVKTERMQCPV